MQCFFRYCVFLAIISIVVAQTVGFDEITSPTEDQILPAGSSVDIVWTSSAQYAGTITITLLQGSTSSALSVGNVIAAGLLNGVGSYTWAISSTIPLFAVYGLKISLDSDPTIFQYSFPFHITVAGSATNLQIASTTESSPSTSAEPTSNSTITTTRPNTSDLSSTSIPSPSPTITSQTSSSAASSSTGSPSTESSSSATLPPTSHGLSKGEKTGIGVGVIFGVLLMACIAGFAFWYGMRFRARKDKSDTVGGIFSKPELEAGKPLNEQGKAELEDRRRAAELQGNSPVEILEIGGGERAELEARRRAATDMFEIG